MKMVAGFCLLVVGGVLSFPGVPGPGIVIILLGLWLLADHFIWAGKAYAWAARKIPGFGRMGGREGELPHGNGQQRASKESGNRKHS